AHVEREHHVQRNLLEADEIDLLRNTVVAYIEVGRLEAENGATLVAIGDQDVDANSLYLRGEHHILRIERSRDADDRRSNQPAADAHRWSVIWNGLWTASISASALRPCARLY